MAKGAGEGNASRDCTPESGSNSRTFDSERTRFTRPLGTGSGVLTRYTPPPGGLPVATGVFQAHMQVELVNDGPVTMLLDTARDR